MSFLYFIYHWMLSLTGRIFYGNPSSDIFVVGVTGTKGKSTTLEIISAILEESGKKTALLSSVRKKVSDKESINMLSNTMPGRWKIQKFLKEAAEEKCDYALIEVTSQGVFQHRHKFIDWDAAFFLNLSPEHIEAHGSFEKYREAKLDFFRYIKKSGKIKKYFFINSDDPASHYFEKEAKKIKGAEVKFFSKDDIYKIVEGIKSDSHPDWLKADFNLENAAAAYVFAKTRGISGEVIRSALRSFKGVRGRMEFVQKKPFSVVVDYAHTPHSLREVYSALRDNFKKKDSAKMICVLGSAGGGRDKQKRPELGKVAGSYCDKIVLTSEDPYNEDPQGIINEINSGISETDLPPSDVLQIIDRKEALKKAISLAKEGDLVISTGMGSQQWFYGKEGKEEWKEVDIAKEIIKKNKKKQNNS